MLLELKDPKLVPLPFLEPLVSPEKTVTLVSMVPLEPLVSREPLELLD